MWSGSLCTRVVLLYLDMDVHTLAAYYAIMYSMSGIPYTIEYCLAYTTFCRSFFRQERIIKHKYRSLADMEEDIMLLCSNARTYNEEGSIIYSDSIELENGFLLARAELEAISMEMEEGEGADDGSTVVEVDYMSDNSDSKS